MLLKTQLVAFSTICILDILNSWYLSASNGTTEKIFELHFTEKILEMKYADMLSS